MKFKISVLQYERVKKQVDFTVEAKNINEARRFYNDDDLYCSSVEVEETVVDEMIDETELLGIRRIKK